MSYFNWLIYCPFKLSVIVQRITDLNPYFSELLYNKNKSRYWPFKCILLTTLYIRISHLIMFNGTAAVVLHLLPEQVAYRTLHGCLHRRLRGRRPVQHPNGDLGGVLPRPVRNGHVIRALVALLDVSEDDLGVGVGRRHLDGLVAELLEGNVALGPGDGGRGLAKDGQVEFDPVVHGHGDVTQALQLDVRQHWRKKGRLFRFRSCCVSKVVAQKVCFSDISRQDNSARFNLRLVRSIQRGQSVGSLPI
jgi:hypothetical protein